MSFGQFHLFYVTVWQQTPEHLFLKTWAKNLGLAENFVFNKKKMVVEFFPEVTKP